MKIITDLLSISDLKSMAGNFFGNMVKAVVDIDKELLAVDAELHADLEALLLENGSEQKNLWGINLYPEAQSDQFVEFDSMINLRPSQGNKGRSVEDLQTQKQILEVVSKRVKQ